MKILTLAVTEFIVRVSEAYAAGCYKPVTCPDSFSNRNSMTARCICLVEKGVWTWKE